MIFLFPRLDMLVPWRITMFWWVFMCFPNVSKTICGLHDKFYVASKDRISQWSLSFFSVPCICGTLFQFTYLQYEDWFMIIHQCTTYILYCTRLPASSVRDPFDYPNGGHRSNPCLRSRIKLKTSFWGSRFRKNRLHPKCFVESRPHFSHNGCHL